MRGRGVARFPDSSTAPSVFALGSSFNFVCQVEIVWMKYGPNVQNFQTFVLDGRQTSAELRVNGTSLKTDLPREAEQLGCLMAPSIPRRLKDIREQ